MFDIANRPVHAHRSKQCMER